MPYLWVPRVNYKEDKTVRRKIAFKPTTDVNEFGWQCPICHQWNLVSKSDFSTNKSYSCFDCNYTCVFAVVPDDILRAIKTTTVNTPDIRPLIIKR